MQLSGVASSSLCDGVTSLSDSDLLASLINQAPGGGLGPTQIIQRRLPISRSLTVSPLKSALCPTGQPCLTSLGGGLFSLPPREMWDSNFRHATCSPFFCFCFCALQTVLLSPLVKTSQVAGCVSGVTCTLSPAGGTVLPFFLLGVSLVLSLVLLPKSSGLFPACVLPLPVSFQL